MLVPSGQAASFRAERGQRSKRPMGWVWSVTGGLVEELSIRLWVTRGVDAGRLLTPSHQSNVDRNGYV